MRRLTAAGAFGNYGQMWSGRGRAAAAVSSAEGKAGVRARFWLRPPDFDRPRYVRRARARSPGRSPDRDRCRPTSASVSRRFCGTRRTGSARSASGMPGTSSSTASSRRAPRATARNRTRPPALVCSIAFPVRFSITCAIRSSSASRVPVAGADSSNFWSADPSRPRTRSVRNFCTSKRLLLDRQATIGRRQEQHVLDQPVHPCDLDVHELDDPVRVFG